MLLTGSYMLRTLLGSLQASSPLIFMPLLQKPLLSSCKETILTELHSPKWVAFTLIMADPPFRVHFFREWMCFWGKAAEGVGTFAEVSKLYLLLLPRGRVGPEVWPRNWGFKALILPHGSPPGLPSWSPPGSAVPSSPTQFRPLSCFFLLSHLLFLAPSSTFWSSISSGDPLWKHQPHSWLRVTVFFLKKCVCKA